MLSCTFLTSLNNSWLVACTGRKLYSYISDTLWNVYDRPTFLSYSVLLHTSIFFYFFHLSTPCQLLLLQSPHLSHLYSLCYRLQFSRITLAYFFLSSHSTLLPFNSPTYTFLSSHRHDTIAQKIRKKKKENISSYRKNIFCDIPSIIDSFRLFKSPNSSGQGQQKIWWFLEANWMTSLEAPKNFEIHYNELNIIIL